MKKEISVVIPVFNEEESLKELYMRLEKSLKTIKKPYEIIFIDDGSTDNTLERLKTFERKNQVKIISFRRNLGKSYALMSGFQKAQGKYIVTIDADLQDDPKSIKELYLKLTKGNFDLVTGWRKNRKDKVIKKLSSKIFNKIVVPLLFNIKLHDLNCGLKIYKSNLAKNLQLYGGMHRFIPVIAKEMGYKVEEKEVIHHERKYGISKYKARKIITDIPDLITIYFLSNYIERPLHFFGKIGSVILLIGLIILTYLSILWFSGESIGRRPLLLLGILLIIVGIQTIFTGLLADLFVNFNIKNQNNISTKYESSN